MPRYPVVVGILTYGRRVVENQRERSAGSGVRQRAAGASGAAFTANVPATLSVCITTRDCSFTRRGSTAAPQVGKGPAVKGSVMLTVCGMSGSAERSRRARRENDPPTRYPAPEMALLRVGRCCGGTETQGSVSPAWPMFMSHLEAQGWGDVVCAWAQGLQRCR